jgi:hypothetical protein
MFKPHRVTPFSVVREVKRGTLSENFQVQGRIADARNAAVNSNEISDINFEFRITPIRLQKHKVDRTFLCTGNCQRPHLWAILAEYRHSEIA